MLTDTYYRKGPAKLHVWGKPYVEKFSVHHLNSKDRDEFKKIILYSETEISKDELGFDKLWEFITSKVKEDPDIKIGDVVWGAHEYTSRPGYGFGIVTFDEKSNHKIVSSYEGMPIVPYSQQLSKIRQNNVTYDHLVGRKLNFHDEDPYGWSGFIFSYVENGITNPDFTG